jgi:dihydrolipoamide dehydrogenase
VENNDEACVTLKQNGKEQQHCFERIILAIGQVPRSDDLGLEHTEVTTNEHGFIYTDEQQRTTDDLIFAVGDVAGGVMLAQRAKREGKVAAEVISGINASFDARVIPTIVFTNPQISWCGLTEQQAKKDNIPYIIKKQIWKNIARDQALEANKGFTKLLIDPASSRIIGAGIAGRNAGAMIAEVALAIEMGGLAEDLALTLHPHPTLSETLADTAELFLEDPI